MSAPGFLLCYAYLGLVALLFVLYVFVIRKSRQNQAAPFGAKNAGFALDVRTRKQMEVAASFVLQRGFDRHWIGDMIYILICLVPFLTQFLLLALCLAFFDEGALKVQSDVPNTHESTNSNFTDFISRRLRQASIDIFIALI